MSQSFKPGVEAAKAALGVNHAIVAKDHPGGALGAQLSLEEVADRILKGRNDPRIKSWAGRALHAAGGPQDSKTQAQVILDALHKAAVYVQDPVNTEFMQAAHETLCLDDKGLCFRSGDCFPINTKLLTPEGLKNIQDIKIGNLIWGYNAWTAIDGFVDKGIIQTTAINTNNGCIVLTANHQVYVIRNDTHIRVRVSELNINDILLVPLDIPFYNCRANTKPTIVKFIEFDVGEKQCYDIQTSDHYVYLPEHDVTVSNCDDLTIAYGSAVMSVGIPCKVVGQAFNGSSVPSHVLAAIQDTQTGEWYRVDPSTDKPVGGYVTATREWWIDPFNKKGMTISGATSGDFVGVGRVHSGYLGEEFMALSAVPISPSKIESVFVIGLASLGAIGFLVYLMQKNGARK